MMTIAWDVDDVLNDLMRVWLERRWRADHAECAVPYDALTENPPHGILDAGLEEYLDSLDAFRLSSGYRDMPPVGAVKDWFAVHGENYRHVAVTAVPLRAAGRSATWVFEHFGRWIRTFHVVPSPRPGCPAPVPDEGKAGFLKRFGDVDFFLDDNPRTVRQTAAEGIRSILVRRPWSASGVEIAEALRILAPSPPDPDHGAHRR